MENHEDDYDQYEAFVILAHSPTPPATFPNCYTKEKEKEKEKGKGKGKGKGRRNLERRGKKINERKEKKRKELGD